MKKLRTYNERRLFTKKNVKEFMTSNFRTDVYDQFIEGAVVFNSIGLMSDFMIGYIEKTDWDLYLRNKGDYEV